MAKKKKNKSKAKKNFSVDTSTINKLLDMLRSGNLDDEQNICAKLGLSLDQFKLSFSLAHQLITKGPDPREIAKLPSLFQMAFVMFAEKDDDDELIVDLLDITGEKAVKKEAKRALHKLRSKGIDVNIPSSGGSILERMVQEEQKPLACQVSPVASDGTRVLVLARYTRGGVGVYQAVVNDEDGLTEFQGGTIGRKQYRRIDQSISEDEKGQLLEVSYDQARTILSKAADLTRQKGKSLPEQYLDASSTLGSAEKDIEPDKLPDELKADTIQLQQDLLSKAETLLKLEEFEEWIPSEQTLKLIQNKLDEVAQSKIIVSDEQRIDQIERAFDDGVKEILEGEEKRKRWHNRLMTNAKFLFSKNKSEQAQLTAAVAWQLLEDEFEPTSSTFFSKMLRKLFSPAAQIAAAMSKEYQDAEEKEDEDDSGNIILTL